MRLRLRELEVQHMQDKEEEDEILRAATQR